MPVKRLAVVSRFIHTELVEAAVSDPESAAPPRISRGRLRARPVTGAFLAFLLSAVFGGSWAGPAEDAGDAHIPYSITYIENRLLEEPLRILDMARLRTASDGGRSDRVLLGGAEDAVAPIAVKWKPVNPPGEGFNNEPRYELAAYRLQQLFLDESEYVVPPVVLRSMPVDEYPGPRRATPASIPGTRSRLFLLAFWIDGVTDRDPFDRERFEADPVYARHWGNLNILTYLIEHKDANLGNVLVSTDPDNPRVFAVDNDVAFRSPESDRGEDWKRLQVNRLPRKTVHLLREISREDLERVLGIVAEFQVVDGHLVQVQPGEIFRPNRGVRRADGRVQFGLTSQEIRDVWFRIQHLVRQVDRGRITLF